MKLFERKLIHALDDHGQDTGPYLWRLTIIELFGWSVKLHYFCRGDEDRDLHDHPWSFASLVLWGGYWEHLPLFPGRATVRRWRGPLSFLWRPAPSPHRIELAPGKHAVTLLLMWPKSRTWGFYTICGWVPWTNYAKAKQDGC